MRTAPRLSSSPSQDTALTHHYHDSPLHDQPYFPATMVSLTIAPACHHVHPPWPPVRFSNLGSPRQCLLAVMRHIMHTRTHMSPCTAKSNHMGLGTPTPSRHTCTVTMARPHHGIDLFWPP
jgi:hypothetical protein